MKLVLLCIVVMLTSISEAKSRYELRMPYRMLSSEVDSSLETNCSAYEFSFIGVTDTTYTVLYSIDGEEGQVDLRKGERLIVNASPGNHTFQFFTWHYSEVFTSAIGIKEQHRNVYEVYMSTSQYPVDVSKPVIYLYPEVETKVSVEVDIFGTSPFFYPSYDKGWECVALPSGELQMDDRIYNYLFWEAESKVDAIAHKEGFIVTKDNAVEFLEKQLTTAGLTSKEQADFITYWAPKLSQHDQSFVHFIFNEACDEFAELKITPTPDHIYRIYILWQPVEEAFDAPSQVIQPMNREGFSVLEWGGMELPVLEKNESL